MTFSHSPCPDRDAILHFATDLSAESYRRLVAHRARQILAAFVPPVTDEAQRHHLESRILEKVAQTAHCLPAKYLTSGAEKVKAVCRIVTRDSEGTGVSIAPGFVLTTHHVLPAATVAAGSQAEFLLPEGRDKRAIALDPDRFFLAHADLDFAIVACSDRGMADIPPIPLTRNPAAVTRHEPVSTIQYPLGQAPHVSLHGNNVERVTDAVIRYRTHAAPAPSGTPIFNQDWELVALHHAGWSDGTGAMNEGIRIAAIAACLLGHAQASQRHAHALAPVLNAIADSSPYLGFFDIASIGGAQEVRRPDFNGTPDFADIGFWNVEQFNRNVTTDRVEIVADAIARLSLDVLGLLEVERPAMERLVQALARRGLAMDFAFLDVPGSQDLALLYNCETTVVTPRDDLYERFRDRLQAQTPDGKSAFPREPLFVQCRMADGNQRDVEWVAIVVHLKASGDAQSRARLRLAAKILTKIVDEIRDRDGLPIVLGGDINDPAMTEVFASLQDTPDLFMLAADDGNDDAVLFVGQRFRSVLDHIAVSRDLQLGAVSADRAAIVRVDRSVRHVSDRASERVPVIFRAIYRDSYLASDPNRHLAARRQPACVVPSRLPAQMRAARSR